MSAPRHTLDQLLVLEAIIEHGSFAAAARALHRVPSAVTYTVKGLEDAVGVPVFDRSGHRAVLTAAGQQVLAAGRRVLAEARSLDASARSLRDGWEPELRVVLDGLYPRGPAMEALRALLDAGAPTRVHLDVAYQDGVHERFHATRAAVMLNLELEVDHPLVGQPLPELELVLVCGVDHGLAGRRVDRAELLEHVELVVRDSSSKHAVSPRPSFTGTHHVVYLADFESKRAGLLAGAGFGWMPVHLVARDLDEARLVEVERHEGSRWTYHPHLVTRADEPLGRAGRTWVAAFVEASQGHFAS